MAGVHWLTGCSLLTLFYLVGRYRYMPSVSMDSTSFNSIGSMINRSFWAKGLHLCWTCTKSFSCYSLNTVQVKYTHYIVLGFINVVMIGSMCEDVYIWYRFSKVLEPIDFGVWGQFFQRIQEWLCLALFSCFFQLVI